MVKLSWKPRLRRLSTAIRRRYVEDEGDWFYSSEWWGTDTHTHYNNHSILKATSLHGNGVVSVLAYPSSTPRASHWRKTEKWLHERCAQICPDSQCDQHLKVLGYQWRVLRFNDTTRQSTAKVMVASKVSDQSCVYYMQQGQCLAVPYLKSMVSAGLTALSSCSYDLLNAAQGKEKMHVLCIGHGGGSLPLFLASKIHGAVIDIVEIDPLVISASINAMGFPSFSIASTLGRHTFSKPGTVDEIFWKGVHERLFLYESDAERFMLNTKKQYDIVFIDAYDGDDVFPRKLWDPDSPFLKTLGSRLHPYHGTVVVNLHSDADIVSAGASIPSEFQPLLPMGKYVSGVCQAYKDTLVNSCGKQLAGMGFTVSAPWVCNTTLVVCKGSAISGGSLNRDLVVNALISKSLEVERDLGLPFSCFQYVNRGFVLLD